MLFAAKPRSRPRKAGAKRITAEPARKPPLLLTVLVLLLIGMFGYGLYSIKGLGDTEPATVQAPAPVAKPSQPAAKPAQAPLPEKPVEEWRYIEELENKTVEVEVPEPIDKPTRPYLMQCGSFRQEGQANGLKAKIAFSGLHSEVRRSKGSNGVWYRVVLGPYDRKRDAERDRHKLARNKINGCQIWFWS